MRRKTNARHRVCAYIYALDRKIYQIKKDEKMGCQTVGDGFFLVTKKIMNEKSFTKLLEMLAI
jgi:hypothetical protein